MRSRPIPDQLHEAFVSGMIVRFIIRVRCDLISEPDQERGVCKFKSEATMRRGTTVSALVWGLMMTLTASQVILTLFLYNCPHVSAIENTGWVILWIAGFLGVVPVFTLRKQGSVAKGQDYTHTTVLVDSGIYGVVRHPQYLSFMLINAGLMLVAQHGLTTVLGILAIGMDCLIVREADREGVEKFGDDYKRYMEKVPGINLLAGFIQLLRRRT
jgi:protein-S-isoprenylcysteine O-methyltransferase Ste14